MKASELDGTLPIFSGVPISWALAVPLAAMAVAVARAIAPVTNLRRIMRTPCVMKTCDGISKVLLWAGLLNCTVAAAL